MLGCLTDTAASIVRSIIPAWTDDQLKQASLLAQEQLFSYGFTSALDAGVSVHQLDLYKELYEDGSLKLRLYPLIMLSSTVLKLVRNIHTKGKIMTMEPMMKKA